MKSILTYFILLIAILSFSGQAFSQSTLTLQTVTGASPGPVAVNVNAKGLNDMVAYPFTSHSPYSHSFRCQNPLLHVQNPYARTISRVGFGGVASEVYFWVGNPLFKL